MEGYTKNSMVTFTCILISVGFFIGGFVFSMFMAVDSHMVEAENLLIECVNNADEGYRINWDNSCEAEGKEAECALPMTKVERWDELKQNDYDMCFRMYK